jgi:simple sugar transport system ATP-binding protein
VESVNYIHNLLLEMRGRNRAILLVSSNLSEILSLADRILVIHQGEMTACLNNGPDVTKSLVGEYMLGLRSQYKAEFQEMKAAK